MTIKQLRELSDKIGSAIVAREARDRAELRQKMAALAKERGLSLSDVIGSGRKVGRPKGRGKSKKGISVKYRDPSNPANTWTGRGRRPKWLNGVSNIEKFRI
ncbi:MAG: H-NS family nucleoid-associated regulatory protein [Hyphomicrobiaceae bacterium]